MQIHQIKRKHKLAKKKQIGRGGRRGKTSGRGTKGQKARAGRKLRPALRDKIKKLPKLRGYGINRSHTVIAKDAKKFAIVNLGQLNIFDDGAVVNPTALLANGLINLRHGKFPKVKILAKGELSKKLKIEDCTYSKKVAELLNIK